MNAHVQNDPTDPATKRPNSPPIKSAGSRFIPVPIEDFGYTINLPPSASCDDPISIFDLYYSPEIIDKLVQYTNNYVREPEVPGKPCARADAWYPTWRTELYAYLAIRIYMTIHIENELSDYWNTSNASPIHPISKHMSRNRFQELHMRWRYHDSGASGPYKKVQYFSTFPLTIYLQLWPNNQYRLNYSQTIFSELISKFGRLAPTWLLTK